jgi:hypothetical protein
MIVPVVVSGSASIHTARLTGNQLMITVSAPSIADNKIQFQFEEDFRIEMFSYEIIPGNAATSYVSGSLLIQSSNDPNQYGYPFNWFLQTNIVNEPPTLIDIKSLNLVVPREFFLFLENVNALSVAVNAYFCFVVTENIKGGF